MSKGKYISATNVLVMCLIVSIVVNIVLGIYAADGIQKQVQSKPSYAYITGVVYEEKWIRINPQVDRLGKVPIYRVKVTLGYDVAYTDSCGYFNLIVEQGTYELKFEKDGYYTEYRVVHVYDLEHVEVEMKQKITLKGGD